MGDLDQILQDAQARLDQALSVALADFRRDRDQARYSAAYSAAFDQYHRASQPAVAAHFGDDR